MNDNFVLPPWYRPAAANVPQDVQTAATQMQDEAAPPPEPQDPAQNPYVFQNWIRNDAHFKSLGLNNYSDIDAQNWDEDQKLNLKAYFTGRYENEMLPVIAQGDKKLEMQLLSQFRQQSGDPQGILRMRADLAKAGIEMPRSAAQQQQDAAKVVPPAQDYSYTKGALGTAAHIGAGAAKGLVGLGGFVGDALGSKVGGLTDMLGLTDGAKLAANRKVAEVVAELNQGVDNTLGAAGDALLYNTPESVAERDRLAAAKADGYGLNEFVDNFGTQGGVLDNLSTLSESAGQLLPALGAAKLAQGAAKGSNVLSKLLQRNAITRATPLGLASGAEGYTSSRDTILQNKALEMAAAAEMYPTTEEFMRAHPSDWQARANAYLSQLSADDIAAAESHAATSGMGTALLTTLSGGMEGSLENALTSGARATQSSLTKKLGGLAGGAGLEAVDTANDITQTAAGIKDTTGKDPTYDDSIGGYLAQAALSDAAMSGTVNALQKHPKVETPPPAPTPTPEAESAPPAGTDTGTPPGDTPAPVADDWLSRHAPSIGLDAQVDDGTDEGLNVHDTIRSAVATKMQKSLDGLLNPSTDLPKAVQNIHTKATNVISSAVAALLPEDADLTSVATAVQNMTNDYVKSELESRGLGHLADTSAVAAAKSRGDGFKGAFTAGRKQKEDFVSNMTRNGTPDSQANREAANAVQLKGIIEAANEHYGMSLNSGDTQTDLVSVAQLLAHDVSPPGEPKSFTELFTTVRARLQGMVGDTTSLQDINTAVLSGLSRAGSVDSQMGGVTHIADAVNKITAQLNKDLAAIKKAIDSGDAQSQADSLADLAKKAEALNADDADAFRVIVDDLGQNAHFIGPFMRARSAMYDALATDTANSKGFGDVVTQEELQAMLDTSSDVLTHMAAGAGYDVKAMDGALNAAKRIMPQVQQRSAEEQAAAKAEKSRAIRNEKLARNLVNLREVVDRYLSNSAKAASSKAHAAIESTFDKTHEAYKTLAPDDDWSEENRTAFKSLGEHLTQARDTLTKRNNDLVQKEQADLEAKSTAADEKATAKVVEQLTAKSDKITSLLSDKKATAAVKNTALDIKNALKAADEFLKSNASEDNKQRVKDARQALVDAKGKLEAHIASLEQAKTDAAEAKKLDALKGSEAKQATNTAARLATLTANVEDIISSRKATLASKQNMAESKVIKNALKAADEFLKSNASEDNKQRVKDARQALVDAKGKLEAHIASLEQAKTDAAEAKKRAAEVKEGEPANDNNDPDDTPPSGGNPLKRKRTSKKTNASATKAPADKPKKNPLAKAKGDKVDGGSQHALANVSVVVGSVPGDFGINVTDKYDVQPASEEWFSSAENVHPAVAGFINDLRQGKSFVTAVRNAARIDAKMEKTLVGLYEAAKKVTGQDTIPIFALGDINIDMPFMDDELVIGGFFAKSKNQQIIAMNMKACGKNPKQFYRSLAHELAHAVTLSGLKVGEAIANPKKASKSVSDVIKTLPDNVKVAVSALYKETNAALVAARESAAKSGEDYYGLTNEHEFLSEIISNPTFLTFLREVTAVTQNIKWAHPLIKAIIELITALTPKTAAWQGMSALDAWLTFIDSNTETVQAMDTKITNGVSRIELHIGSMTNPVIKHAAESFWQKHFNSDEGVRQFSAKIAKLFKGGKIPDKYDIYTRVKTLPHRVEGRQARDRAHYLTPIYKALDAFQKTHNLSAKDMEDVMERFRQYWYYRTAAQAAHKFAAVHSPLHDTEASELRGELLVQLRDPSLTATARKGIMNQLVGMWRVDGKAEDAKQFFGIDPITAAKKMNALKTQDIQELERVLKPLMKSAVDAIAENNKAAGVLGRTDAAMRQAYGFDTHVATHWLSEDLMNFTTSDQVRLSDTVGMVVGTSEEGNKSVNSYMHPIQAIAGELVASGRRVEENHTVEALHNLAADHGAALGLELTNKGKGVNIYSVKDDKLSFSAGITRSGEIPFFRNGTRITVRSVRDAEGNRNAALMNSIIAKFQSPARVHGLIRGVHTLTQAISAGFTAMNPKYHLRAWARDALMPAFSYAARKDASVARGVTISTKSVLQSMNPRSAWDTLKYLNANPLARATMAAQGGVAARLHRLSLAGGLGEGHQLLHLTSAPSWLYEAFISDNSRNHKLGTGWVYSGSLKRGTWTKAKESYTTVLNALFSVAHYAATVTALNAFEASLEDGMSDEQAAAEALLLYDPLIKGSNNTPPILEAFVPFVRSWRADLDKSRVELLGKYTDAKWVSPETGKHAAKVATMFGLIGFTAAMMQAALLGDDPEDGIPYYAKMDSADTTWRIFVGGDKDNMYYVELPFGNAAASAAFGTAAARYAMGYDDVEETVRKNILAASRSALPVMLRDKEITTENIMRSLLTSAPLIGIPANWFANDNGFGGKIYPEGQPRTGHKYDSGFASSPELSKDAAEFLYNNFGMDVYPQSVQYWAKNMPFVGGLVSSANTIDKQGINSVLPTNNQLLYYWQGEARDTENEAKRLNNLLESKVHASEVSPAQRKVLVRVKALQHTVSEVKKLSELATEKGDVVRADELQSRINTLTRQIGLLKPALTKGK